MAVMTVQLIVEVDLMTKVTAMKMRVKVKKKGFVVAVVAMASV